MSREFLLCWLDDVGDGDIDVNYRTDYLRLNLVDLNTFVPNRVAKSVLALI